MPEYDSTCQMGRVLFTVIVSRLRGGSRFSDLSPALPPSFSTRLEIMLVPEDPKSLVVLLLLPLLLSRQY